MILDTRHATVTANDTLGSAEICIDSQRTSYKMIRSRALTYAADLGDIDVAQLKRDLRTRDRHKLIEVMDRYFGAGVIIYTNDFHEGNFSKNENKAR